MAPQSPLTAWPEPASECRFGSFHLQSSPSFLEKWWKVREFPRLDLPISELAATRTLPPPSIKVLMVSTLMLPPKSERSTRLGVPEGSSPCSSDIWTGAGGLQTSHNQSHNSSLWRPKRQGRLPSMPVGQVSHFPSRMVQNSWLKFLNL